jgi:hypothetical protein
LNKANAKARRRKNCPDPPSRSLASPALRLCAPALNKTNALALKKNNRPALKQQPLLRQNSVTFSLCVERTNP